MEIESIINGLEGKKVLFIGKTKTMSEEDIELFLEQAGAQKAENEHDSPIGMIVFGRLVNPVEEAMCDEMEKAGTPVVPIEKLEAYYAATIDAEALIGSLTLFRNRERIINLLHNRSVSNSLFCEILKLYDWEGKGPFEGDENRDVAGSIVMRFYPDIERNHNIQYSPLGPFLVAAECKEAKLLEAMARIPDYEISQRSTDFWMPRTLHESLLINPSLPPEVLTLFLDAKEERKRAFAAMHPMLDAKQQRRAADSGSELILTALARNARLDSALHERLLESGYESVVLSFLSHQPLSNAILEAVDTFGEKRQEAIGSNPTLDEKSAVKVMASAKMPLLEALAMNENLPQGIYEALFEKGETALNRKLAANRSVGEAVLLKLVRIRDKEIFTALAANPSMPQPHLKSFSKIKDRQIMAALASNPSTPIEILLGYQMDAELSNILKRNEAFGDYIKQNIGW